MSTGRGFHKKTVIIACAVIVGIALIAEAVLLIKAFTGEEDERKGKRERKQDSVSVSVSPVPEKTGKMFRPVEYTEMRDGELYSKTTCSYDEQGRAIRTETEIGDHRMVMEVSYEKSGTVVKISSGEDIMNVYFIRDSDDPLTDEKKFRIPTDDYEIEYDERGYWKTISYKTSERNPATIYGRDYHFDDAGRMTGYEEWQLALLDVEKRIVEDTVTYEYDESGRVTRYTYHRAPYYSSVSPYEGEYRIEYGDGWKKETKYVGQERASETLWICEKHGTRKEMREYRGEEIRLSIEWAIKMPDSYLNNGSIWFDTGDARPEADFPYRCETDSEGRITAVKWLDENGTEWTKYEADYDDLGRLTNITSTEESLHGEFVYDENGNVAKVIESDWEKVTGTITFRYITINIPIS